tara:strand:- start:405 stop:758 length:354 start_codon:yes stop_codon:yes gene_type:complete
MSKLIAVVMSVLMSVSVLAGPYVEYKNQIEFDKFDSIGSFDESTSNLRVGTSFKVFGGDVYAEVGKFGGGFNFNGGESSEVGYQFKFNNGFTVKGMVESVNDDDWSHRLEAEVRYSF